MKTKKMGRDELSNNPQVAPSKSAWAPSYDQLCAETKKMGHDGLSNNPQVAPSKSAWAPSYEDL